MGSRGTKPAPLLRVFLSSTAKDLQQHRDAVAEIIERQAHAPVRMETFGSRPGLSVDECRGLVDEADILVVVVAHRYGWVPTTHEGGDGEQSITRLEVQAARDAGIPVLAYLVDGDYAWPHGEEQDRLKTDRSAEATAEVVRSLELLDAFKDELGRQPRSQFTTPDDLAKKVAADLGREVPKLLESRPGVSTGARQESADELAQRLKHDLIDFRDERARHGDVLGRDDLVARVSSLVEQTDRGFVVVTGGPGVGKSALLHAWLLEQEAQDEQPDPGRPGWPHHFMRRGQENWARPEAVRASLAAQAEQRFPEQADVEARPEPRLRELLVRVSGEVLVPKGQRLVLLLDGMDEVEGEREGTNPLQQLLPHPLPPRVVVLCSTRPTDPHLNWLLAFGQPEQPVHHVDLDRETQANTDAVSAFWEHHASTLGLDAGFIDEAVAAAEGNLLHAAMLRSWLIEVAPAERRAVEIPRGLAAATALMYDRLVDSAADASFVLDGMALLCVARESLTLDEVARILEWDDQIQRRQFRQLTRSLLLQDSLASGEAAFRPFHESLRAHVLDECGTATTQRMHQALIDHCVRWPPEVGPTCQPPNRDTAYTLRHGVHHLLELSETNRAQDLCTDMSYLTAKIRLAGSLAVHQELSSLSESAKDSVLSDLATAVRGWTHRLQDADRLPDLLANDLVGCRGWSPAELLKRVHLGPKVLRLRASLQRRDQAQQVLEGHGDSVTACAFSPDGSRVASASHDGTMRLWDAASGQCLQVLGGHGDWVSACALSQNDSRMASASRDTTLRIWDSASGKCLQVLEGHGDWVTACDFSIDGTRLASASFDQTLRIWDSSNGQCLRILTGHAGSVSACAFSPVGTQLASAGHDGTLRLWDIASGDCRQVLRGHGDSVRGCAFSIDGTRLASASHDRTLRLWDTASGKCLRVLEGHGGSIRACAFSPDGTCLASASFDGTLRLWDIASGECLLVLKGHGDSVSDCAFSPDGTRLASASHDRTLRLWDSTSDRLLQDLKGHEGPVRACAFSPDGTRLASASHDRTLRLWDSASGECMQVLRGHRGSVRACAFSPDGTRLASASYDRTLRLWDTFSSQCQRVLNGHEGSVSGCAFSPDGTRLSSAGHDRTLRLWDIASGDCRQVLVGDGHWLRACASSPDGNRLASASFSGALRLWSRSSGQFLQLLEGHQGSVLACAFSPDGSCLASASSDQTLRLWDSKSGKCLQVLEVHEGPVNACAFSPDGTRLASASSDGTLCLWDTASGQCLHILFGMQAVNCVAVTDETIAAGDQLGNVWFLYGPRYERAD